jgi:hypothetical protein
MMGVDITNAAGEYDVSASDVAKEMSRRRSFKKKPKPTKKPKTYGGAREKCRECGQDLEHGESTCPLCGTDTSFIWGGLSMEGILTNLKKLCEDGLKISERTRLRKALKDLGRDMTINSSKYSKALNKKLVVEVKKRR